MKATSATHSVFTALVATVFLSGCAFTNRTPRPSQPQAGENPRTELVLLNVTEASGWVAYSGPDGKGSQLEEYRIVVIRSRTNELIYDSTVPMASDLRTHGFEMDQNDPRLRRMATAVDRDVIAPLEAFQRETTGSVTPPPQPAPTPLPAPEPEAVKPSPSEESPPAPAGLRILDLSEKSLRIALPREESAVVGARYFVRAPDRSLRLPGIEEEVVTKGEISGLVEISSVKGLEATATLVSGEIPANATLEPAAGE